MAVFVKNVHAVAARDGEFRRDRDRRSNASRGNPSNNNPARKSRQRDREDHS